MSRIAHSHVQAMHRRTAGEDSLDELPRDAFRLLLAPSAKAG